MLHLETVELHTLSVIQQLQQRQYLSDFLLVGGTALALQLGHRTSTDIDLFSNKRFNTEELLSLLRNDFPLNIRHQMNHALLLELDTIKTDFVYQPSILLAEAVKEENIIMASLKDIAAMKLSAITARGRKRDFVDLYILLNYFSLPEMLGFFLQKYPDATAMLAIRSLFYFEDADNDFEPKCFFKYDWNNMKKAIILEASKL